MMKSTKEISIIGLGAMGSTLTQLLLRNNYNVTVWNRTSEKANPLVQAGAVLAPNVAAAISASSIVVICVFDYKASNSILITKEVVPTLTGKLLIQLTTGSPREAQDSEKWAHEHGAEYIDGAIQAAPSQMGRPDTPILVSGAADAFHRSEPVLKTFGGSVVYLGEQVGAASAMDLATLSYIYGSALGFIHGAHIAEVSGIRVDTYGSLVADITPTFGEFLKHEATVIHTGNYTATESPLRISVEATKRILQQAQEAQINAEFPALAASLFKKALEAGYGDEEAAALIKVLRARV